MVEKRDDLSIEWLYVMLHSETCRSKYNTTIYVVPAIKLALNPQEVLKKADP